MTIGFWFAFFLGALTVAVVAGLIGMAVFYAIRHPRRRTVC